MIEVISYQTEDGQRFDLMSDALRHEARQGLYTLLHEHGVGHGGEWNAEMIGDAIIEDLDNFVRALHAVQEDP